VLSPQKDWFMNVSLAERVLDVVRTKQDYVWDDKMTATAKRIYAKEQYAEDVGEITGKTLAELTSPYLKAMWVRAYDEAHNVRNYRVVTPEGGFGDWVAEPGRRPAARWPGARSARSARRSRSSRTARSTTSARSSASSTRSATSTTTSSTRPARTARSRSTRTPSPPRCCARSPARRCRSRA
jgi:hypothetical protein